jgi:hypothetical protein
VNDDEVAFLAASGVTPEEIQVLAGFEEEDEDSRRLGARLFRAVADDVEERGDDRHVIPAVLRLVRYSIARLKGAS